MSFLRRHLRVALVAVCCAGLGAAVSAIATAGAATPSARTAAASPTKSARGPAWQRLARRAVHADAVVATKHGFVTVTLDRGYLERVSGDTLTVREATKTATYKTVTLTLPADARVRNNGHRATLGELRPGERVVVLQGLARAQVVARAG